MKRVQSLVASIPLILAAALWGCTERADQQPIAPGAGAQPAAQPSGRSEVEASPTELAGAPAGTEPKAGAAASLSAGDPTDDGAAATAPAPSQPPDAPALKTEPAAAAAPGAYVGPGDSTPSSAAGAGILRGVVRFEGEPPKSRPLNIGADAAFGCVHAGSVDMTDRSLLLDDAGGIANVVLTIKVAGQTAVAPDEPVVLDQQGCRFEPHVVVVPAGSIVRFGNSDGLSHNVHTYPRKNDAMNKLIAAGSHEDQHYPKADTIEIKCDIHSWMNSFVVVTDAPFHAVTGPDGRFEIHGLPPGPLELSMWHEQLGRESQRVDVVGGQASEVELTLGKGGSSRPRR